MTKLLYDNHNDPIPKILNVCPTKGCNNTRFDIHGTTSDRYFLEKGTLTYNETYGSTDGYEEVFCTKCYNSFPQKDFDIVYCK